MATVSIYIRKRPAKDGKFPISIRITINREQVYIMTGQKLDSLTQWDEKAQRVKKSHPNSIRLNNFLLAEVAKANNRALEMETKGQVSAKDVKKNLEPVEIKKSFFKEIADQYLEEHRLRGNYDVWKSEQNKLKRFYSFIKNDKMEFKDITVELLQRYIANLRISKKFQFDESKPPKPLGERTIANHLIVIRTIFNRAIAAKLVSKDNYPFGGKGNISIKIPSSSKMGLDEFEIKKLEEIDLSGLSSIYDDARNIWLTEFYFAGMRVTDCLLLKWTDFHNGRLYYVMSKNGEPGSVKIPEKAQVILDKYIKYRNDRRNKHRLVFPFLLNVDSLDNRYQVRKTIAFTNRRLNKAMAYIMQMIGCNKNASQHKARHSFAQRAEEKEIHPKVLQKMYRHESVLTTMKYQSNFSFKKADDAIDAVLDF